MDVKVTFLGHATFLVEAGEDRILIDPHLAPDNPACPVTVDDFVGSIDSTGDLGGRPTSAEPDYILVTHGHFDHVSGLKELAERTRATVVAGYEICAWLSEVPADRKVGMQPGGGKLFSFGHLYMTAALHGSMLPDGSYGGVAAGLLIRFSNGKVLYHAGDTGLTYEMRMIGERNEVDLALLPIGDLLTMGPEDAVVAAQFVNAKGVVPMHYNTFPGIEQDPNRFADLLKAEGIGCQILESGGETIL